MRKKISSEKILIKEPLRLDSGDRLEEYQIAFETFGKLNKNKTNAILICHALTGDQFCTGKNPITKKMGGGIYLLVQEKLLIQIFFL